MKIFKAQTIGKTFYFEDVNQAQLTANIFGSKVEPIEITELKLIKDECDLDQMRFFIEPIDVYFTVDYKHYLDSQNGRVIYEIERVASYQDEDGFDLPLSKLSESSKETLMILAQDKMFMDKIMDDEIFEHHSY
jgi:hypothetical protein